MKETKPKGSFNIHKLNADFNEDEGVPPISIKGFVDSTDVEGLSGKSVRINIENWNVKKVTDDQNSNVIEIALREIRYCDEDGAEYKMYVLGSQIIDAE